MSPVFWILTSKDFLEDGQNNKIREGKEKYCVYDDAE